MSEKKLAQKNQSQNQAQSQTYSQTHWNKIYRQKDITAATAAEVLLENTRLLPAHGKVLDYACGLAGNGFYLANKGYDITLWDVSDVAIEKASASAKKRGLKLQAEVKDLEKITSAPEAQFDVIVVSYFLHRESLRSIYDYLKKDGLLFYQTFSGKQFNGVGPSREAFRLQRGELLKVYADMKLLYYREDLYQEGKEPLLYEPDPGRQGLNKPGSNKPGSNKPGSNKPGQVYFVAMK
ncbi:hypothetical protein MNBD_GAMMA10-1623 [hydrothermal vent metagenome]|uniref:Tellurite resistance methyltransferase TehB-like domain-containing protein n=1 Tax=hydrothermal vent metagenome TaxID=652676 RepID=A0A3B0YF91_9ZZZZ